MKRVAIVCTGDLSFERARIDRVLARGDQPILIAPPALAAALGLASRWIADDAECAAPNELLLDSQRARLALETEHRSGSQAPQGPIDEIRFAASTGAGWATAIDARQGGALHGARIVLEVEASDTSLLHAGHVRYGEQIFREARLAALRDATAIEGDAAAIAALKDAGVALALPEEEPAWSLAETPVITAVIAHKDHGRYLPACLAALRAQTLPLQILIVDDGSGPESLAVLAQEEARDPKLRVIRQANAGPGAARNTGIAAAQTELVLIVDADNLLRPAMAARLAEALRRRPDAAAATCAMRRFNNDGTPLQSLYCGAEISLATLFVENTAGDACSLHRRRHLLEAGGFSPDRTSIEDWDLWMRYAGRGLRNCVVPEVLFDYRVGPDSRSVNMPELKLYSARLGELYPELLASVMQPAFAQLARERWHERLLLAERLDMIRAMEPELRAFSRRAEALEARIVALSAELAASREELSRSRSELETERARSAAMEARAHAESSRAEAALREAAAERAIGAVLLDRAREMQDYAAQRSLENAS